MKKLILLSALVLVLLTCSILGDPSELQVNQSKWDGAGITHYRYNLTVSCFCPFREDMPVTIEVQDDKVVSMTKPDGTAVQPGDPVYDAVLPYSTINSVFSSLKEDYAGKADEITVTYDTTYFYPASISIDYIKNAMDDEVSIYIENFEVVK